MPLLVRQGLRLIAAGLDRDAGPSLLNMKGGTLAYTDTIYLEISDGVDLPNQPLRAQFTVVSFS